MKLPKRFDYFPIGLVPASTNQFELLDISVTFCAPRFVKNRDTSDGNDWSTTKRQNNAMHTESPTARFFNAESLVATA
jgi:hypothetical protein